MLVIGSHFICYGEKAGRKFSVRFCGNNEYFKGENNKKTEKGKSYNRVGVC